MEIEINVSQAENMRTIASKTMPFTIGKKALDCISVYHGHKLSGCISLCSIIWIKREVNHNKINSLNKYFFVTWVLSRL